MRTEYFKYLLEIEKQGSLNVAANNLYISRTSLISALNSIEKELGYKIFFRDYNGTYPTLKGEKIIEDLKQIIPIIDSWTPRKTENSIIIDVHFTISSVLMKLIMYEIQSFIHNNYSNINLKYAISDIYDEEKTLQFLEKYNPKIYIGNMINYKRGLIFDQKISALGYKFLFIEMEPWRAFISKKNPLSTFDTLYLDDIPKSSTVAYPDFSFSILQKNSKFQTLKNTISIPKGLVIMDKTLQDVEDDNIILLTSCMPKEYIRSSEIKEQIIEDLDLFFYHFMLIKEKELNKEELIFVQTVKEFSENIFFKSE